MGIDKRSIDTAANHYLEAKAAEDLAAERTAKAREALIATVQAYGTTPPRSDKSLRLDGDQFQVTVTTGSSTSIDYGAVEKFFAHLREYDLSLRFKKIFRREVRYSLSAGADDLVAQLGARAQQAYRACICVTTNKPSLKVERKKDAAA